MWQNIGHYLESGDYSWFHKLRSTINEDVF